VNIRQSHQAMATPATSARNVTTTATTVSHRLDRVAAAGSSNIPVRPTAERPRQTSTMAVSKPLKKFSIDAVIPFRAGT
jgi:hypothetical protein